MSLARTTLSSACAATDTSIVVANATGFAAGNELRVDGEVMRVGKTYSSGTTIPLDGRGLDGTYVFAHPTSAGVVVGSAGDWANAAPQTVDTYPVAGRARTFTSYSAAGAIALPTAGADAVAFINGTALAMTLALPTKDLDGSILIIVGTQGAAHSVTVASGLGGATTGYTVGTFDGTGQCSMMLIACNSIWVPLPSPFSGTLTAIDVAVA